MLIELKACPLCGSADFAPAFVAHCVRRADGRDWPVARCKDCTLGFLNPQPDWAELQAYYTADYDPYTAEHSIAGRDAEIAAAKAKGEFRHIPIRPGLKLLDVGCGGGAFLSVARGLGAEVHGVEPSEHGAKAARAQGLKVFHGQLHDYVKTADKRFDVVTANHVVEHHPAPVEALRLMGSLVAPGGTVWFAVPNLASATASALKARWHSIDAPYHLMHFTPEAARRAVERAGLKLQRLYTYSLPSAAFASLCDVWRYRYYAPRKITQRLGALKRYGERRARAMDEAGEGEAIIVEATP